MTITFVTSFFHIFTEEFDGRKTTQWRIERFKEIADSGIPICIYVSNDFVDTIQSLGYQNVKIMSGMEIQDLWVYGETKKFDYSLPVLRNEQKDIEEYIFMMYSKLDFLKDTMERNPWNTDSFAWIDFNVSHIFQDKSKCTEYLKIISRQQIKENTLVIPGCWEKEREVNLYETICWRFCGGFFVGDKNGINQFYEKYRAHYPEFIQTHHKLVWEVNFWAWLEKNKHLSVQWYYADHTDEIVSNIPSSSFVSKLTPHFFAKYNYYYPQIQHYSPSSASYVCHQGTHFLCTRYINYYYYDSGASYVFYDGTNIIRSKHIFSPLTIENQNNGAFAPLDFFEFKEDIELPKHEMYARGIEDIRLFSVGDKLRFIGTTVEYYHTGGNRMIVGDVDLPTGTLRNGYLIESPYNASCEKNWIPLIDDDAKEWFIYRWSPFEIGYIEDIDTDEKEKKTLKIAKVFSQTCSIPFFNKVRGSSTFVESQLGDNTLIGVVHYCEGGSKRQYYHMLVSLDKTTYCPIRYSDPFVFEKVEIEFCIGFTIKEGKYWFWISQMDRDPIHIGIEQCKINLINNINNMKE